MTHPLKLMAVSKLRQVNAEYLRNMKEPEFIVVGGQISHALLPYEWFLKIQAIYHADFEAKGTPERGA